MFESDSGTSKNQRARKEMLERYCHVIDANTALNRYTADGKTYYECMNKYLCDKHGGCKNDKFGCYGDI